MEADRVTRSERATVTSSHSVRASRAGSASGLSSNARSSTVTALLTRASMQRTPASSSAASSRCPASRTPSRPRPRCSAAGAALRDVLTRLAAARRTSCSPGRLMSAGPEKMGPPSSSSSSSRSNSSQRVLCITSAASLSIGVSAFSAPCLGHHRCTSRVDPRGPPHRLAPGTMRASSVGNSPHMNTEGGDT